MSRSGPELALRLGELRSLVDAALHELLPPAEEPPATLHEAMRYSLFAGGKRVRPVLALLAAEACGAEVAPAVRPAAALELVHTYSLVHDDLPAMDDDDLRRGRPTNHMVFGEATAILAGDGLLTLAFEVLARHPEGDELGARRAEAVLLVARASGTAGMVGGQEMDLRSEGTVATLAELEGIHRRKTCALLEASVGLGGVLGGADASTRGILARYGAAVGLAFQITDDVLDVTGDAAQLGKTPGKDARDGKVTYPALLGVADSRSRARSLSAEAVEAVAPLGARGEWLAAMALFVVERLG